MDWTEQIKTEITSMAGGESHYDLEDLYQAIKKRLKTEGENNMLKKISHEVYTDSNLGIEIHYTVLPEDETFDLEMETIFINDKPINLNLEEVLFTMYGDFWEEEIRKELT